MYNVINKNVKKNIIFILNLSILLAKLRWKYHIEALQWHGSCTRSVVVTGVLFTQAVFTDEKTHPCVRAVHTGRAHVHTCEPAFSVTVQQRRSPSSVAVSPAVGCPISASSCRFCAASPVGL